MVATKKTTKKKATKKKATKKSADVVDPRAPVPVSPKAMDETLAAIEQAIGRLTPPAEPETGQLVSGLLHRIFADGLPCGHGQEALRRIDSEYVDRNEYRVTEAYETEEVMADLDLPETFERCRTAKEIVGQIYNDQNSVSLEFLREAPAAERKGFYMRVPVITPPMIDFLAQVVSYEEILFSPRSTQRAQARIGFDPKAAATTKFFDRLRELIAPFGHVPMQVGADTTDGKPLLEPELCPMCLLARLGAKK
ncbi:MAG: hypothetical protein KDB80_16400 [Planctomycetes bacterium]|nr:hypothetical protein [Planctomycetota bacterium]